MESGALLAYDPAEDLVNDLADPDATPQEEDARLTPDMIGRWIEDAGRISGMHSVAPPPLDEEPPPVSQIVPAGQGQGTMMQVAGPATFRVPRWLVAAFAGMFAVGCALIAAVVLR